MVSRDAVNAKVPPSAAWLGGLGALPFIALAGASFFLVGAARFTAAHALAAYGATILSFLGGVHWGLAIAPTQGLDGRQLIARLGLSVAPSLAGWGALLVPGAWGLVVLAVAIAAMLWVDLRAARRGQTPLWYPRLRVPLTIVVVVSLLIGALA